MKHPKNKLLFILLALLVNQAFAQDTSVMPDKAPGASVPNAGAAQPTTMIKAQNNKFSLDFDDELITGKAVNPGVDFVFVRGQYNGKKLIRLRDNFLPELENGKQEFSGKK